MARDLEMELESELEDELAGGFAHETSHEFEDEYEDELAHEFEGAGEFEWEASHEGLGEFEWEASHEGLGEFEWESEFEWEGEDEGEEFFGRIARGVGRFVKKHSGAFKSLARAAAPWVGRAVGGMLGGPAGAMLGSRLAGLASKALREGELEFEFEDESAHEWEAELEGELEFAAVPSTQHEALAEYMAAAAAEAQNELEAEALAGAATAYALSAADRRTLRHVQANLISGSAVLAKILGANRETKTLLRTLPAITGTTARVLTRRAQAGQPVTRRVAAQVMAATTRRVIGSPRICTAALRRNVVTSRRMARTCTNCRPRSRRMMGIRG